MIIETDRLILRTYTWDDFPALYEILSDPVTMAHYPKPYDENGVRRWIQWSLDNYEKYGFGLWAIVLKETGEFIGDCGITLQNIDGCTLPEIGYHIHKNHWRKGYAKEAAKAVRDWAFENTDYPCLYSYMKYTNAGSYGAASSIGMRKIKEYEDEADRILFVYAITRREWENMKNRLNELLPPKVLCIWNEWTSAVEALYDTDRLWDKGFGDWKIEYKYRRGGKTLCTFYAKENRAVILITYGKAEREKFEKIRGSISQPILNIYDQTKSLHDGKWLWIALDENTDIDDIIRMLKIKRRPNRK
ncbi:MAG: GNAT family N-acetyltransferase [Clostridia bacterium]|nr:GNAT family N-acetyltransferase [Clostridia bacterium]MBQ4158797.1 GNAT family N-acetyltransferase [Clostridia bacterium]